jgi:hypothetical protein
MKDGICPMCHSKEVYMTEGNNYTTTDKVIGASLMVVVDKEMGYFRFDTYLCLTCGYTVIFGRPAILPINLPRGFTPPNDPGLSFLKQAKEWKKVG